MKQEVVHSLISSLLPEHDELNENYNSSEDLQNEVQRVSEEKIQKQNAATLAKIKLQEKKNIEKIKMQEANPTYGLNKKQKEKLEKEKQQTLQNIAELEVIEDSPEAQNFLSGEGHSDLSPYAGTTKRDVVKLLDSLNINLNLYLTRTDTYNLLSCLLTCNENQLNALYSNPRVPLAIKTVIKRLKEDAKLGNVETIERLWDRIFGKTNAAMLELPQQNQSLPGIIPNTVVSREAYMVIRDTIIGK